MGVKSWCVCVGGGGGGGGGGERETTITEVMKKKVMSGDHCNEIIFEGGIGSIVAYHPPTSTQAINNDRSPLICKQIIPN